MNVNNSVNNFFEYIKGSDDLTPRQVNSLKNCHVKNIYEDDIILLVPNEQTRYLIENIIQEILLEIIQTKIDKNIKNIITKIDSLLDKPDEITTFKKPHFKKINYPSLTSQNNNQIEKTEVNSEENTNDGLLPDKTFDNFVPGKSNNLAHSSAVLISEDPGKTIYNPLYIHSAPGLGKTHLLMAIGNHVKQIKPKSKILYTTAENFVNMYVEAMQKGTKSAAEFNKYFKSLDLLLMDDIQFLTEKQEKSTETFYNIFNILINKNKQVVIASDVTPDLLKNTHKRMKQRFKSAVYFSIDAPEYETRLTFIKKYIQINQAKFIYNDKTPIIFSEEMVQKIARNVFSSIRELIGIIINIVGRCSFNNEKLSESMLDEIITEYCSTNNKEVTLTKIVEECANYFGVEVEDIKGTKRIPKLVDARQIAMYISRQITNMTVVQIATFYGKDHTSVVHADKKIKKNIKEKENIENQINELVEKILK